MDRRKVIFLADDDIDDREFFQDALSEVSADSELVVAEDGVVLMETLNNTVPPPYVIFLDLNMPRKNGYECLADLRNSDKYKDIPVVIFSTTDNPDVIAKTRSLGANLYLRKPTSFDLLKKMIERVLSLDLTLVGITSSKEGFYMRTF